MVGECVRSREEFSRDVDHIEIKVCKIKKPMSLVMIQVLGLVKVCQVLMISENLDGKGRTLEIILPGLESADDS